MNILNSFKDLAVYKDYSEAVNSLDWLTPTPVLGAFALLDESLMASIKDDALLAHIRQIQSSGFRFQVKQCTIYWDERRGVLAQGKTAQQNHLLPVLQAIWETNRVACQVNIRLDALLGPTRQAMNFEQAIGPQSLKQLPAISVCLHELRELDLLISSPIVSGARLMEQGAEVRLLFNEVADEQLEILDYVDLVWERVEQYLDYYEAWQEKLIEYRSFFSEAVLEIVIILLLLVGLYLQVVFH